jgi:hypothetical protein
MANTLQPTREILGTSPSARAGPRCRGGEPRSSTERFQSNWLALAEPPTRLRLGNRHLADLHASVALGCAHSARARVREYPVIRPRADSDLMTFVGDCDPCPRRAGWLFHVPRSARFAGGSIECVYHYAQAVNGLGFAQVCPHQSRWGRWTERRAAGAQAEGNKQQGSRTRRRRNIG